MSRAERTDGRPRARSDAGGPDPVHHLRPVRGELRPRGERCAAARSSRSAAMTPTRCRGVTSARRPSRCRTSTRTPTACARRCAASATAGNPSAGTRPSSWWPAACTRSRRATARVPSAAYLGNPNVHSLGFLTHGVSLVRALGSKAVFSATSIDQLPHQLVSWALYGHQFLIPIPDIDRTSLFVVFGGNPMASNGSIMTVPDFPGRLRELKARGGRMVVFDPRRTETAKVADEHHFVRPGTDVLVLLAIINVLFAEGLTRPAAYVDGIETVRAGGRRLHTRKRVDGRLPRAGGRHPAARARDRRRRRCCRVRAHRSLDAGVRHAVPVGDPRDQHPHRQPRPRGRRAHDEPCDRHGRAGAARQGPPRRLAQPRARPARVRRRAAGLGARRGDRDARATDRSARSSRSRATPCRRRPAGHGSTPRSRGSTSWCRSTCTSTRRLVTPT